MILLSENLISHLHIKQFYRWQFHIQLFESLHPKLSSALSANVIQNDIVKSYGDLSLSKNKIIL